MALVALALLPGLVRGQAVEVDRILAIVNGSVLMQSDVRAFSRLGLLEVDPGPDQEADVLSALVDRRLILDQVDRFVVAEPGAALVDSRLAALRRELSAEEVDGTLRTSGLSEDDLRQVIADDLRRDAYLDDRFGPEGTEGREAAIDAWVGDLRRRGQVRTLDR